MITFTHIEDYLEVLAGYRAITHQGRNPGPASIFGTGPGPVNLARYDVGIVQSMASHTVNNGSLTDRQSELVLKIIGKYRKQFKNNGVDVEPSLAAPKFRNTVRVIDRTKSFSIVDNKIVAKFPYDKSLINYFSTASKENLGSCQFDRDKKEWHLGLTTYNVNWAATIAKDNGFVIDDTLQSLNILINDIERSGFNITMDLGDNCIKIYNIEPSMEQYIKDNIGGFDINNLSKLADMAPVLGYGISNSVRDTLLQKHNKVTLGFMLEKQVHYPRIEIESTTVEFVKDLKIYIEAVDRYPIYVYEPDSSGRLKTALSTVFNETELLDISTARSNNYLDNPQVKCVYFNRIKKFMRDTIPLLVSTNAMLYGADKQYMLQLAEKVVYYTSTTLNKEATTIAG